MSSNTTSISETLKNHLATSKSNDWKEVRYRKTTHEVLLEKQRFSIIGVSSVVSPTIEKSTNSISSKLQNFKNCRDQRFNDSRMSSSNPSEHITGRRNMSILYNISEEQKKQKEAYEDRKLMREYYYKRPSDNTEYNPSITPDDICTSDRIEFPSILSEDKDIDKIENSIWSKQNTDKIMETIISNTSSDNNMFVNKKNISKKTQTDQQMSNKIHVLMDMDGFIQDLLANEQMIVDEPDNKTNEPDEDGYITVKKNKKNKKNFL